MYNWFLNGKNYLRSRIINQYIYFVIAITANKKRQCWHFVSPKSFNFIFQMLSHIIVAWIFHETETNRRTCIVIPLERTKKLSINFLSSRSLRISSPSRIKSSLSVFNFWFIYILLCDLSHCRVHWYNTKCVLFLL